VSTDGEKIERDRRERKWLHDPTFVFGLFASRTSVLPAFGAELLKFC
jgi:hypothetical protein